MSFQEPKPGDSYLLFHRLPYDFSEKLPLPLGRGVYLDRTPQAWLDSADPGLADFLLPGYSLPGTGLCNCCLRCFSRSSPAEELSQWDMLSLSVLALRLYLPIDIRIGGAFCLGDEGDRILSPTSYENSSMWCCGGAERYTRAAIIGSESIANRLSEVQELGFTRLLAGLVFFGHVSVGFSQSFQLSFIGLFAALEALFVPKKNKAATLSRRVAIFLNNFPFPEPMEKWVNNEYINGRNKIAHGIHDATFGATLNSQRYKAFGQLHEITRLSLLGFLSLSDNELRELSEASGSSLQKSIEELGCAAGVFLEKQRLWSA